MDISDLVGVEWLTEEEISPHIRRAQAFRCDSSDEEDEEDSRNQTILENLETDFHVWYYAAQAIAIKLLHSRRVQEAYKAKIGNMKRNQVPSLASLNEGINLAAKHVCSLQKWDYDRNPIDENSAATNILKTIRSDFKGFFKSLWTKTAMAHFFRSLTEGALGYQQGSLLGCDSEREHGQLNVTIDTGTVINYFSENFVVNFSLVDGWVDFFSSLRLYNRMAKDVAKYRLSQSPTLSTKWVYKYKDEQKEFSINVCDYSSRSDYIPGLGTYPSFPHEFSKEELDVLPSVVNAEGHMVSEKAVMLHFLLFGVEAMRSPSALIHHMMFLDLVKTGKRSWQEDCEGRKLPMSIRGAVGASRMKHNILNRSLNRKYTYDYKGPFVNEITRAVLGQQLYLEKEITQDWLKMKLGDEQPSDPRSKIKLIQNACKEWYGIDVEE